MKHYITITFLAFINLFVCFAPGIVTPYGDNVSFTIFELMVGGVPGLTTAFVFYITALVFSIVSIVFYFTFDKNISNKMFMISSGTNSLLYLLVGILVLSVVPLSVGPTYSTAGFNIGIGSIFFGIISIVIAIASAICEYFLLKEKNMLPAALKYISNKKTSTSSQALKNEHEVVSLLKEYKSLLDDGIITEEEFNKKRNELLGKDK